MAKVQKGDTVRVQYTGRLEDGTVFASTKDSEPLRFVVGEGEVVPGFEQAVLGMEPGETTTVTIAPEHAYGPRQPNKVVDVQRDRIATDIAPRVGDQLHLYLDDGRKVPVVVTDVSGEAITIDANHPLAGQTLIFDIELVACE